MFFNEKHPPNFEWLAAHYEPLTDEEFAFLDEDTQQKVCLNSFVNFAYQILKIRPKKAALPVRFYLNREQRYLLWCLEKQMREIGRAWRVYNNSRGDDLSSMIFQKYEGG